MFSAVVLIFALPMGQGCPHEGADHRLFGHVGCAIQRKMTIEHAKPPRRIWSIRFLKVSVKIDPRHPHLLVEWPARRRKLWRFRAGYRWDANAQAYIFPALGFKKVDGPMAEYQKPPKPQLQAEVRALIASPPLGSSESCSLSTCQTPAALPASNKESPFEPW